MLGKTHMMVGIAATLAITHPDTLSGFVTAAGIGAIGALISDIDVGTSSSHRDANRVIFLTIAVAVIFLAVDYFGKFGLVQTILQNSSIVRILLGVALFLVVCAFGKETPHRSFMHSFTALAALDAALCLIYPSIAVYFTIGFLSHLATDIFNKKKVRLLYPMKGGVCLNLFHAYGTSNTVFFIAGCAVTALETILLLARIAGNFTA